MKKTKSERILDTVFFKHKHITHPTLTQADTIVKAIDDLTHVLKGSRNMKGMTQIKALEMINEILNKIPTTKAIKNQRVTFDKETAPPQEIVLLPKATVPISKSTAPPSIQKAIIDKPIHSAIPNPRVQEGTIPTVTTKQPSPRVQNKRNASVTYQKAKLRSYIKEAATNRARLLQRYSMQSHSKNRENTFNWYTMRIQERTLIINSSSGTQNTQKRGQDYQPMNLKG